MDSAVAIVQANLQVNGHFIAFLPLIEKAERAGGPTFRPAGK